MQRILYREAYIMLGDSFEAEDAVQNLYMRLWEKRDELESLVAPEAYLRAMKEISAEKEKKCIE